VFAIRKRFEFSASHKLDWLPAEHPCSRLHGHNYGVVVELVAEGLDHVGMVYDFGELEPVKRFLDETCDHRDLNDVLESRHLAQPTAEVLAAWFYGTFVSLLQLPSAVSLTAVAVEETPKTWAEYRPGPDEDEQ